MKTKLSIIRFSKKILLTGLGVFLSSQVLADNELQIYVNQLKTFSANFEQIQPEEDLFKLNKATGYFKLQRPGKLQWIYQKPDQQKIVVDGANLWVQDDDLEQVTVRPINDVKGDIPLSWLLYDEKIESRFKIIKSGSASGMQWFNLTPKQATYFQSIEIGLDKGQMKEVWMYQSADNITKVRFKNIKENQPISPNEFSMSVPENYDLVGQME